METLYRMISEERTLVAAGILVVLLCWESIVPFFGFFRSRVAHRARHALRNFALGLINNLMIIGVFIGLWAWVAEITQARQWGLLNLVALPFWLKAIGAVLLFDLWTYWFHRWNHEVKFLWRFHRVHHSDFEMDVTTANRFHVGESFFSSTARVALIPLFGAELWHLALYESLMFPIVQFHHSNVGLSEGADRLLRLFIVTPAMHKVHHSKYQPETDSNYTSLLSVWDRLFRTFRLRKDPHEIDLGLDGYTEDDQRITRILADPARAPKATGKPGGASAPQSAIDFPGGER